MTDALHPTSNLAKTQAFYQKANIVLRLALITAVLWPAFAIAAALFLTPFNAQTLVPLVTLSPLVPMFLFLLGNPFKYLLAAEDPDVKAGSRWAAAFIGVELSIGVYFSVIPVSNDTGLVPLLILTACAIFFLRLAQVVRWLTVLLMLLLIGITLIFILGGRPKIETELQRGANPPGTAPVVGQPPEEPTQQINSGNFNAVCQDALGPQTDLYFPNYQGGAINVTDYGPDCFGPVVHLPEAFGPGWCAQPYPAPNGNPDPNWTLAFQMVRQNQEGNWVVGETTRTIHWSSQEEPLHLDHMPLTLRLKGQHAPGGGTTFRVGPMSACEKPKWPYASTSGGSGTASTPLPTSGRVAVTQNNATNSGGSGAASTASPTSGPVAVTQDADNYEFGFWPCRRAAAALHCVGYIKNEYTEGATVWLILSGISDDEHNQYEAQSWSVYGGNCGLNPCYATLAAHQSQNLTLKVDGVVPTAKSLTVTFRMNPGSHSLGDVSITIPISTLRY